MQKLIRDDLRELLEHRAMPSLSVFMPTRRTYPESQQNRIRFKNQLSEAESRLREQEVRAVGKFLAPARKLLDDDDFWINQDLGLGVFLAEGVFRVVSMPYEPPELCVVNDRFYIKPLVPLLDMENAFYVLALSQKTNRLLRCTGVDVEDITPQEMPSGIDEALWMDDPEKSLQFHTGAGKGQGGKRAAVFHGQGADSTDMQDQLKRYLRAVEKVVHDTIKSDKIPLVLAGVEYLHPVYRDVNSYPHLVENGVTGNPEKLSEAELRAQAMEMVAPVFAKGREKSEALFAQQAGTGLAVKGVEEIVPAAVNKRVATLFVARGVQVWGNFDPATNSVGLTKGQANGSVDLLDMAAVETFLNGGTVYAVDPEMVPGGGMVAALFRY